MRHSFILQNVVDRVFFNRVLNLYCATSGTVTTIYPPPSVIRFVGHVDGVGNIFLIVLLGGGGGGKGKCSFFFVC